MLGSAVRQNIILEGMSEWVKKRWSLGASDRLRGQVRIRSHDIMTYGNPVHGISLSHGIKWKVCGPKSFLDFDLLPVIVFSQLPSMLPDLGAPRNDANSTCGFNVMNVFGAMIHSVYDTRFEPS